TCGAVSASSHPSRKRILARFRCCETQSLGRPATADASSGGANVVSKPRLDPIYLHASSHATLVTKPTAVATTVVLAPQRAAGDGGTHDDRWRMGCRRDRWRP